MPREKSWKVWVAILIVGVFLIAYHLKDLPYTWDYIGLDVIMGLIGFLMLVGTTTTSKNLARSEQHPKRCYMGFKRCSGKF